MAATREEEEDRILEEKRKKIKMLEKNTLIVDIMKEKAVKLCSEQMNELTLGERTLLQIQLDNCGVSTQVPPDGLVTATQSLARIDPAFNECCKDAGFLMAFTCRKESKELKACFNRYYNDPTFVKESEIEFLLKKNK